MDGETNRYYYCKICQTNVVWRLFNIRKHLESQHNLSLGDYAAAYENDNQNKGNLTIEISKPSIKTNSNMNNIQQPTQKVWYEGCIFTCQFEDCKIVYNVQSEYTNHISNVHKMSMDAYYGKFGNKGEILKQYQCLICDAKITHKYN